MVMRVPVVAAIAVVGAGAVLATVSPASPPEQAAQTFTVPPAATSAACPGPQRLPVGDVGTDGALASDTDDRELLVWGLGATSPMGEGSQFDGVLGASFERVGDGDLRGLAAITCVTAQHDEWLVGGSTSLGSSTRVVLSNPAAAPAEATLTIYGPLGQVGDPVVVAVPPHGQSERLLEAVAAEIASLVVHVESTGPGVVATLQDSRLQGFHPGGTDWVGTQVPGERLIIPSVGSEVDGATAMLRLLAPDGATVQASLVSAAGVETWGGARSLTLEPGVVTEVSVPAGIVGAIEITADAPVVAAARTVVPHAPDEGLEGDLGYDHRWVSGFPDQEPATLQTIAPGAGATLAVYAPVATTVTFVDADGRTLATVSVPARTLQRVPFDAPAGTVVSATARAVWLIEVASEDGTSVAALQPVNTSRQDRSVTVVPGSVIP